MKMKLFILTAVLLAFVLSMFAAQTTVTGVITDNMCTRKHMMPGKTNADCVRACIEHGADYVLVTNGKTLELKGDKKQLSNYAGKKATLTGNLNGNTLQVSSVSVPD